jgi:hypothetical protein
VFGYFEGHSDEHQEKETEEAQISSTTKRGGKKECGSVPVNDSFTKVISEEDMSK